MLLLYVFLGVDQGLSDIKIIVQNVYVLGLITILFKEVVSVYAFSLVFPNNSYRTFLGYKRFPYMVLYG